MGRSPASPPVISRVDRGNKRQRGLLLVACGVMFMWLLYDAGSGQHYVERLVIVLAAGVTFLAAFVFLDVMPAWGSWPTVWPPASPFERPSLQSLGAMCLRLRAKQFKSRCIIRIHTCITMCRLSRGRSHSRTYQVLSSFTGWNSSLPTLRRPTDGLAWERSLR